MKLKENNFVFKEKRVPDSIFKDAPYAFVEYYGARDMEKHPGRMEWSGTTSCCNETVKGSDYGEDENCPCCSKNLIWDKNGRKKEEYLRPFKEEAKQYNDEQKKLCEERLFSAIEELAKDAKGDMEGFRDFSQKVAELFVDTAENDYKGRYYYDNTSNEAVSWATSYGNEYKDKITVNITLTPDNISIYIPYYDVYTTHDEDGHPDEIAQIDGVCFSKKISMPLPFVKECLDSLNTPELLEARRLQDQYSDARYRVTPERVPKVLKMANKIGEIEGYSNRKLQGEYKYIIKHAAINSSRKYKKETTFVFENDGEKGRIYVPKIEHLQSEDKTRMRHYTKDVICEFDIPEGVIDLPKEIMTTKSELFSSTPFVQLVEKCKNDLTISVFEEGINRNGLIEMGPFEGAFEFEQFDMVEYFVDDIPEYFYDEDGELLEEEITRELSYEIEDGDLYLSAIMDENNNIQVTIRGVSEFEIKEDAVYPLTPTENKILFDRIGEKIKEAQKEYELELEREDV